MTTGGNDNVAGLAELDRMIERIKLLPGLGKRAAPDVADVLEVELQRSIAAGNAPDGTKWQLTRDGRAPLRNAAKAMHVAAIGPTVYVRLVGIEARHHSGRARGQIVRQVIPTDALSPAMVTAVRDVLSRHFTETMRGEGGGNA